jgi:hypothetical protein
MNRILDAVHGLLLPARRALAQAWDIAQRWLSVPFNFCLALIGLIFVISFSTWAIVDRSERALLYFPDAKGVLHGEVREVPHSWGKEARADLIASEVLLGPKSADLLSSFPSGVRVESILYRKGRLFLDISASAALATPASLKTGIKAMERSIHAALPGLLRITLTIGGKEPYSVGLTTVEGGLRIKKGGK